MPEIVPVAQKFQSVAQEFEKPAMLKQLQMALPRAGITAERMARIALTEMRRTPKLLDCTRESLLGAIMQCAQLGLEPGPMGLAWLIPYRDRKKGTMECQFQLGYKGLLKLVWQSNLIANVAAEVIYEKDDYSWDEGSDAFVKFRRSLDEDRGEAIAVFGSITTTNGGRLVRVMSISDVQKHRAQYVKAPPGGPWDTDFDEMACKTVLKRVAKRAPVSAEAQQAIQLDDRAERGMNQQLDFDVRGEGAGAAEVAPNVSDETPPTNEAPAPEPRHEAPPTSPEPPAPAPPETASSDDDACLHEDPKRPGFYCSNGKGHRGRHRYIQMLDGQEDLGM